MTLLYLFSYLTQHDDCCVFSMSHIQILVLIPTVLTGFPRPPCKCKDIILNCVTTDTFFVFQN